MLTVDIRDEIEGSSTPEFNTTVMRILSLIMALVLVLFVGRCARELMGSAVPKRDQEKGTLEKEETMTMTRERDG